MHVEALIFDFDGLIVDTEVPTYEVWRELFAGHGTELSPDEWVDCIGREHGYADPMGMLEARLGIQLDRESVKAERRRRLEELISGQPPLPGIVDCLEEAARRGIPAAVASSAPRGWVLPRLEKLGLAKLFAAAKCREDAARAKPAPDLFLAAAGALGADPGGCVVLEDSPIGVTAAKAAGMFCVAVPNELTGRLDLSAADITVSSLTELPLPELLRRLESATSPS